MSSPRGLVSNFAPKMTAKIKANQTLEKPIHFRAELHTHTYIVTELAGYLARPDRPPQTEASCLRAFFRRAEERPAVALKLAIDFLLMEGWRAGLIEEATRRGLRLVSRREDAHSARQKLRALVDPVLRKASAKLQAGRE